MLCQIKKLPPGIEVNPGNHYPHRAGSGGRKQALVIIKATKYRQLQWKCLSEHLFGIIKRSLGFNSFPLRGKG